MGTDNLFHKRKERKAKSLRRRRAMRAPYDVILIVCEGGKTEPNYFSELKKAFRLSNTNVRIFGRGADPLSVVNFAIKTFRQEPEFDRVYCVFDRDRHTTYDSALDKVRRTRLGKGTKIFAISSVPCFEFWLLLHFIYTTKPFDAPPGNSICSRVIEELKKNTFLNTKREIRIFLTKYRISWVTPLQMPAESSDSIKLPKLTILPPWFIPWWNICGI